MSTILALYENKNKAQTMMDALEARASGIRRTRLLEGKEASWLVQQIARSPERYALWGGIAGAIIGALSILLIGPLVAEIFGFVATSAYMLWSVLAAIALGIFFGALTGARAASQQKILLEDNLVEEDATLLVADADQAEQKAIIEELKQKGGKFVSSYDINYVALVDLWTEVDMEKRLKSEY